MIARRGPLSSRRRIVAVLAQRESLAGSDVPEAVYRGDEWRRASPASAGVLRGCETDVSERRRFWLRVLFALDVLGAGGPGVLMLVRPDKANEMLFAGGLTPDAGTALLGCVWVSLGILSLAGLLRPVTFSPVLLVQFGYKLVWLAAVGGPLLARGGSAPPMLAGIFAGWVLAVGLAAPWRWLFGRDGRMEANACGLPGWADRSLERIPR